MQCKGLDSISVDFYCGVYKVLSSLITIVSFCAVVSPRILSNSIRVAFCVSERATKEGFDQWKVLTKKEITP